MNTHKAVVDAAIHEFKKLLTSNEMSFFEYPRCEYIFNRIHEIVYYPYYQRLLAGAILLVTGCGALVMIVAEAIMIPRWFRLGMCVVTILMSLIVCPKPKDIK